MSTASTLPGQAAATQEATPELPSCSKCGEALDTDGNPQWCKACRAQYQRDYRALRAEMTESRGYAAGISAMREHLAVHFERLGSGPLDGYYAAALIRQSKGPDLVTESPRP